MGGVLATASVGLGSSATSSSDLGAASAFAGGAAGEGPGSGIRDLDERLVRDDLEVRLEDFLTFSPAPASSLSLALSIFLSRAVSLTRCLSFCPSACMALTSMTGVASLRDLPCQGTATDICCSVPLQQTMST